MKKRPRPQEKESIRTGTSPEILSQAILDNLYYVQGRSPEQATKNDWYMALAYTVRDRLLHNWVATLRTIDDDTRVVSYLSAEFLMGPQLGNNLINLGIWEQVREALVSSWAQFRGASRSGGGARTGKWRSRKAGRLLPRFPGNPGSSRHRLRHPLRIRYLRPGDTRRLAGGDHRQVAAPGQSLGDLPARDRLSSRAGRPHETYTDAARPLPRALGSRLVVKGVAYDYPVQGYRVKTGNLLRLWKAEAVESFDFQAFNVGDYYGAVEEKVASETITKVLYPNDEPVEGKRLRLEQQYFFVSCSLQDMIRIHLLEA